MRRFGSEGLKSRLVPSILSILSLSFRIRHLSKINRIIPDILNGKKRICLAITEPNAGSDVNGIETAIETSADDKTFISNGQKKVFLFSLSRSSSDPGPSNQANPVMYLKWITSGMYADYFLTLAKDPTGGQSLLVVPRVDGVGTRHIVMSGSSSAGTAFVEFDDVKVPTENIVGERGKAFKYIVSNLNHEVGTTRGSIYLEFNSLDVAK